MGSARWRRSASAQRSLLRSGRALLRRRRLHATHQVDVGVNRLGHLEALITRESGVVLQAPVHLLVVIVRCSGCDGGRGAAPVGCAACASTPTASLDLEPLPGGSHLEAFADLIGTGAAVALRGQVTQQLLGGPGVDELAGGVVWRKVWCSRRFCRAESRSPAQQQPSVGPRRRRRRRLAPAPPGQHDAHRGPAAGHPRAARPAAASSLRPSGSPPASYSSDVACSMLVAPGAG